MFPNALNIALTKSAVNLFKKDYPGIQMIFVMINIYINQFAWLYVLGRLLLM